MSRLPYLDIDRERETPGKMQQDEQSFPHPSATDAGFQAHGPASRGWVRVSVGRGEGLGEGMLPGGELEQTLRSSSSDPVVADAERAGEERACGLSTPQIKSPQLVNLRPS